MMRKLLGTRPDASPEWISASLAANKYGSNYYYATTTSSVDPADLLARAHGPEGQTLGEASGDFLGFDIGL